MKIKLISAFFVFLMLACNSKMYNIIDDDIKNIEYNTEITPKTFFDISMYIDTSEFEIIILESPEEAIIGQITDVYLRDNIIVVVDSRAKCAFSFDRNGDFINVLGKIGDGPEEYRPFDVNSIIVSENKIGFYDFMKREIKYFDFQNNYINTVKNFPISAFKIYPINNEIVCMTEFRVNNNGLNHINVIKENSKIKSYLPFDSTMLGMGWGVERTEIQVGDNLYFHVVTKDTIFKYNKETGVTPLYALNIQGNYVPEEVKRKTGREALIYSIDNDALLGINSISVLNDLLLIKLEDKQLVFDMVMNKNLGVYETFKIQDLGAYASVPINTRGCCIQDGYLIKSMSADDWINIREYAPEEYDGQNSSFNKQLWDRTANITEEDNPFLILFKIKE